MARIISYKYDLDITDGDAWIGSDATTLSTRQFTAAALAEYLNIKGKVHIAKQMLYKYVINELGGAGTFSLPGGGVQNIPFTSITSLTISESELGGQNVAAYIQYLVGTSILIASQDDIGNFGHYKVTSYSPNPGNASYYDLVLQYTGSNGSLLLDKLYTITDFNLPSDNDKNFVFVQSSPELTWTISHPLNKYASVSVANFNGYVIHGVVDYTSVDEVVITFTSPVAGRAFLN